MTDAAEDKNESTLITANDNTDADAAGKDEAGKAAESDKATDGDKGGDSDGEDKGKAEDKSGDDKSKGAPESYADFTLPEGQKLEGDRLTEFQSFAKENNWTQEQAQKAIDQYLKWRGEDEGSRDTSFNEMVTDWTAQSKADKEFGGDKFEENMAIAKKGLAFAGGEALVNFLDESKLGNHPEIIRAFYRVGKAIADDTLVTSSAEDKGKKSFYPNSNMQ